VLRLRVSVRLGLR